MLIYAHENPITEQQFIRFADVIVDQVSWHNDDILSAQGVIYKEESEWRTSNPLGAIIPIEWLGKHGCFTLFDATDTYAIAIQPRQDYNAIWSFGISHCPFNVSLPEIRISANPDYLLTAIVQINDSGIWNIHVVYSDSAAEMPNKLAHIGRAE